MLVELLLIFIRHVADKIRILYPFPGRSLIGREKGTSCCIIFQMLVYCGRRRIYTVRWKSVVIYRQQLIVDNIEDCGWFISSAIGVKANVNT